MTPDVCVVTGGGSGLGELIARAVADRGLLVVVADVDGAAATRVAGAEAAVTADLRDPHQVPHVIERAVALGRLKWWVNCAGAWSPSAQYPDGDEWRGTLALDLETPMLATQLCLGPMQSYGGGAVVNVSSSAALGDAAYASPEYATAKAGLIRFTTSAAGLAATHGVRVSCVVPHWIGLPRAYNEWAALSREDRAASGGLVPAAEVVDAVLSLADDAASAGRVVELRGRPVAERLKSG
jgi:NAD(P)-dependent dehydrogenase (short-subunit alcohol dehydrogenase family)